MLECPHCFRIFRTTPDKLGARCPKCRMPMFERPNKKRGPDKSLGLCNIHPGAPAVAECSRCKRLICAVCRTRWHDQPTCPDCVERSVKSDEPTPHEASKHLRLAWVGAALAVIGWAVLLLSLWPAFNVQASQGKALLYVTGFLFFFSFLPALIALGQSAAALRLRGTQRAAASTGLIASGLQIGLMVGVIVINLWNN